MYELGFCYPYDSRIFWDGRSTILNKHWITVETFTYDEIKDEEGFCVELRPSYQSYANLHLYVDNLNSNIILNPQILQLYEKEDTCLCIIKTLWLKIFQRKYKNYYNKKMNYYKNPRNIRNRELYGRWV